MKVLIAAVQHSSEFSGLQRHSFNMTRCLLKQPDITEVHFVVAPWQRELAQAAGLQTMDRVTVHVAETRRGIVARNLWYYRHLPELVAEIRPDVVHLSYPVPVDASAIKQPIVLTLHDLYPYEIPENFGFPKVLFNRAILQQCLRSVHAIACVSDTTLSRLKHYSSPSVWKKASRIYNCVEPEAECADSSPLREWSNAPFLLSVSQHRRNKNIPLLLRVMHRLLSEKRVASGTKLVVIGITGPETNLIEQLVDELGMRDRVRFVNGLSEPQLQWCYRNCEVFVAPSSIEGFGLPVAEALLVGCRVVCSDIPAFREIDEDHCRFVELNAEAEDGFVRAIAETMQQSYPLPLSLPQFSETNLGAQYMQLYRGLLAEIAAHAAGPVRRSERQPGSEVFREPVVGGKELVP